MAKDRRIVDSDGNEAKVTTSGDRLQVESSGTQATNIAGNTVTIGAAEGAIVASRTDRRGLIVFNNHTSNTLYIGPTGLTTASGLPILPMCSVYLNNFGAALYGIASAANTDVRYIEVW